MTRTSNKLTDTAARRANKPGLLGDGDGLYLSVSKVGTKSWLFKFMLHGRSREMGLGPYPTITLARAREKAMEARRLKVEGIDPIEARDAQKQATRAASAKQVTFRECAGRYIQAHRAAWKNEKHAAQWGSTLETYAYPTIGSLSVAGIETGHITQILEPIWTVKNETASRVRGRIESILDYAATHGWRSSENPARWKGHLENVLAARSKVGKTEHHPALPWKEIAAFVTALELQEGVGALALRFAILTAARTSEVLGATWGEIDNTEPRRIMVGHDEAGEPLYETEGARWTIHGNRMKAGKEHRVPLPAEARHILAMVAELRTDPSPGAFLFPGAKPGQPLSNMALMAVLRRMGRHDLTVHGFRSTFRDWCAETGKPTDLAEGALAHAIPSKTIAAYRREDLLERRRRLMEQWATFCGLHPLESVSRFLHRVHAVA